MKRFGVLTFATIGGAALISAALVALRRTDGAGLPTALVTRGTFDDSLTLRGDIRPVHSIVMTAPASGSDLQIVELVRGGTVVSRGDVVVRFDATAQQRTFDQKRSELQQAEADLEKARAEERRRVQAAEADLGAARAVLARARLDLAKAEISSRIDAEKLKVAASTAEQHVAAAEEILGGERAAAGADVTISRQKRDKARYDVADNERVIAALTMRAPADGTVSLLPNTRAGAAFSRSAPEFKRGDRAWFGAPIVELPDLRQVQMNGRLDEVDRAKVRVGGTAIVHADALPDRDLHGTIQEISATAKPDFTTWPPVRNFDVSITLGDTDARLRPGINASARLAISQLRDVLIVPSAAVFQNAAASVVYVVNGTALERRAVTVVRRTRDQVVLTGDVRETDRVALKQPDSEQR
jgi:HlyD family secretion protein